MKIREIRTERITKEGLKSYVHNICTSVKFYGKFNDMIFMMIDKNTGVFDLKENRFIIFNRPGIAYPVVDSNNNNYFMVITSKDDNKLRYNGQEQPRYEDTSEPIHMYDDNVYFRDKECFCNIFDEKNKNVYPIDKYLSNIYQINSMLDGNPEYKTITYRDCDEDGYLPSGVDRYTNHFNLPSYINKDFKQILPVKAINTFKNKDINSFNLDVVYTKWRYSVINRDKGLIISYDESIKDVQVVDNDVIMLKNNNKKSALYDINKGYLISFDDNIEFDRAYKLTKDVFKLEEKNGYRFLIKNNISSKTYKDIYITFDNIIIAKNLDSNDLYNVNGSLILSITSNNFYKCDDDIFFCENNRFYNYNLKSSTKHELNILSLFKLEDGTKLNIDIDEALQSFTHCYYDKKNSDFTLFKEKKFGIEIDLDIKTANKWFDTKDQKDKYLQALSDFLINIPIVDKMDNYECKKKTKKLI